jgi:spore coat protein CotH
MVAAKRSVTIRGDLDSRIEARVGPRGYSAYVNKALDTQIQLDLLDEIIAASIADHGPVPDHVFDEIASDVQAARARRR